MKPNKKITTKHKHATEPHANSLKRSLEDTTFLPIAMFVACLQF